MTIPEAEQTPEPSQKHPPCNAGGDCGHAGRDHWACAPRRGAHGPGQRHVGPEPSPRGRRTRRRPRRFASCRREASRRMVLGHRGG